MITKFCNKCGKRCYNKYCFECSKVLGITSPKTQKKCKQCNRVYYGSQCIVCLVNEQ